MPFQQATRPSRSRLRLRHDLFFSGSTFRVAGEGRAAIWPTCWPSTVSLFRRGDRRLLPLAKPLWQIILLLRCVVGTSWRFLLTTQGRRSVFGLRLVRLPSGQTAGSLQPPPHHRRPHRKVLSLDLHRCRLLASRHPSSGLMAFLARPSLLLKTRAIGAFSMARPSSSSASCP